jgi:hypothetical protein
LREWSFGSLFFTASTFQGWANTTNDLGQVRQWHAEQQIVEAPEQVQSCGEVND